MLIPLVEWEIDNPGQRHRLRILQAKVLGKLTTQPPQHGIDHGARISPKEDCIAVLSPRFGLDSGQLVLTQKLSNWALGRAVLVGNVGQAARTLGFGDVSKAIDLLAAQGCTVLDADCLDTFSVFEHAKFGVGKHVR